MQVANNTVVAIDYTLTDNEGTVIDSSEGRDPLAYIQGTGQIIPGLEQAMEGRSAGERFQISINPDDAYGQRDEGLIQEVPMSAFDDVGTPSEGQQFQAVAEGGSRIITVMDVGEEQVTVDANHPLAGRELNFDVRVVNVRQASDEELEHGHVHDEDEG